MEEVKRFIEDIDDYLEEIILCGIGALNNEDEQRLLKLQKRGEDLGLFGAVGMLKTIREEIENREILIYELSKLREYLRIFKFKMI